MISHKKGFSLIELLVTIGIIGLLASSVLASLSIARQKSRDVKRVADLQQLQIALALYFDDNRAYPTSLLGLVSTSTPTIPTDPLGSSYLYAALGNGATCDDYHLGATLELSSNDSLNNDVDAGAGTACTGGGTPFAGTDPIFDLKP